MAWNYNEQTLKNWTNIGLLPENEEFLRETKTSVGTTRGYWGSAKSLRPMDSAILYTLYNVGPDITLSPKEMVNRQTRIAAGLERGCIGIQHVPMRGQESCGHDEYEGDYCYRFYELKWTGEEGDRPDNRYSWEANKKDAPVVRFDSQEEADKTIAHHLRATLAKHADECADDFTSPEHIWDCDTWAEQCQWMLDKQDADYWKKYLSKAYEWMHDYKGECAWKDDPSKRCSHHDGLRYENAIVAYKNFETGEYEDYPHAYEYSYRAKRLKREATHELVRLDDIESDVDILPSDELVIETIKRTIPKMKTESRPWIQSTYQKWDSSTKEYTYHGKRGYYSLAFWSSIGNQRHLQQVSNENRGLEGTVINGWKFATHSHYSSGNVHGEWVPTNELYFYFITRKTDYEGYPRYSDDCLSFRTEEEAKKAADMLQGMLCVDYHMWKGKPTSPLIVGKESMDLKLHRDADPRRYTPESTLKMLWDGKVPDDFDAQGQVYESKPREVKA